MTDTINGWLVEYRYADRHPDAPQGGQTVGMTPLWVRISKGGIVSPWMTDIEQRSLHRTRKSLEALHLDCLPLGLVVGEWVQRPPPKR